MRIFLALTLPEPLRDALSDAQSRLVEVAPTGRPVDYDDLHLTLAFCADAPPAAVEDWHALLAAIPFPGLTLTCTGLDRFEDRAQGLVFMGIRADPALTELHRKVAQAARLAGLSLPRRRFRPHVTLLRGNRVPGGAAGAAFSALLGAGLPRPAPAFATEMALIQSRLTPTGARHEVLARYGRPG